MITVIYITRMILVMFINFTSCLCLFLFWCRMS